ncbi:GAF domain-containing protein [Derxia gummosa]|uniref:GAF domain-containing protein n=1 Tax=Derxia gummosa DSM 723 TaxID=1121388 RepID=A0A9U5CSD8_9BURK|nr:GAF domain-containing protein [Derxia gummosa]
MNRPAGFDLPLASVRRMFEGVIPATLCTASPDGVPHLCFLTQVEYVDDEHVALSFQFFNRSRQNILATRRAALTVDDPYTAAGIELDIEYLRTEQSGPLFERMKAKLAGIAAHTGMTGIYRLQGADVYRVLAVHKLPGRNELEAPAPRCDLASASRALSERLAACTDMAMLIDTAMTGLRELLRIDHSMLLLADPALGRLYTVASLGYERSGLGSEIAIGQGIVGLAAREGVPMRIGHMSQAYAYGRAIRATAIAQGVEAVADESPIPLPGLANPRSQLAVPLRSMGRVIGVLLVESDHDQHFSYDDEDALTVLSTQLAMGLTLLQPVEPEPVAPEPAGRGAVGGALPSSGAAAGTGGGAGAAGADAAGMTDAGTCQPPPDAPLLVLRHHAPTDSVFLGADYLIKGVAGAILMRLVETWQAEGRCEFTNRELRVDPRLRLPDITDNLEARLILLQRRLAERDGGIRIEKTGRGRFRLVVAGAVRVEAIA